MSKIITFPCAENDNKKIVQTINELYEKGIEGIVFAARAKDGITYIQWTTPGKQIDYFRLVGMLETAKQDLYAKSMNLT